MSKYIKLFDTHTEYQTYINGSDKILPNVSYCEDNNDVHYNQWYDPERLVAKFNVTSTTTATSLFNNPTLLKEIEIDGVKYTGNDIYSHYNHTFDTTGIHTVKYTLVDGTTNIDNATFASKNNMVSITIPNTLTSIGTGAFASCTGLTSVTIPNSVTSIGDGAFYNCNSLTSITIPDSVTTIGQGAFRNCSGLKSITIPNSVTTIGGCLGNFAFENVIFETINPNATFVRDTTNKILTNIAGNILICGFNNSTIPNTVNTIGDDAFTGCGLTSIGAVGSGASLEIPNSVTTIGSVAFRNCSGLKSITIPNSVTSIGDSAFAYCPNLTSVTIGNSVTSIGASAFAYCTGLTSITCLATTAPTINANTFWNIKTGGTLTVPSGNTGYDVWMGTGNYYLGKYNWTKVEQ